MAVMQKKQRGKYAIPRDEIDQMIGKEPAAPEQAARQAATEIFRSVKLDVNRLVRDLTISGHLQR